MPRQPTTGTRPWRGGTAGANDIRDELDSDHYRAVLRNAMRVAAERTVRGHNPAGA